MLSNLTFSKVTGVNLNGVMKYQSCLHLSGVLKEVTSINICRRFVAHSLQTFSPIKIYLQLLKAQFPNVRTISCLITHLNLDYLFYSSRLINWKRNLRHSFYHFFKLTPNKFKLIQNGLNKILYENFINSFNFSFSGGIFI